MQVSNRKKGENYSLGAMELRGRAIKSLSSELAQEILKLISKKSSYPKEIAETLKEHEQKVYYHIRNLERAGVIKVVKEETHQGATAKYYGVTAPALVYLLRDLEKSPAPTKEENPFLKPFIENGELNATIIIGSPYSHGSEHARSRDGYYGIDLALFLGTFLSHVPASRVRLDTETRLENLKTNLILLGGPAVNKITEKFNTKLPIRFEKTERWSIKSTITKKKYTADETGLIVKIPNPYMKGKEILVVAGTRYSGTRAATLAFMQGFEEIAKGNRKNKKIQAKVVLGVDLDSDGVIDSVEFKE